MNRLRINKWYLDNVLIPTEGLKYFPAKYNLKIIDDQDDYYDHCKVWDDLGFELFYDIPKNQIIREEDNENDYI